MNPDLPDIRDVHGPVEIASDGLGWLGYSIITLAVLALLLVVYFLLNKKKKPEYQPSAFEVAINGIDRVKSLMIPGHDKEYSIAISDVVRQYIESTLKIHITDRTTEEFLKDASEHPSLKSDALPFLKEFLSLCDLAKFAGQSFTDENRQDLYNKARQFIDELNNISPDQSVKKK